MKVALFCLLFCVAIPQLSARIDSIPRNFSANMATTRHPGVCEENHIVRLLPPCRVVGLRIFYLATSVGEDTIHLTSTSRLMPNVPLSEQWRRAGLVSPIVVNITRDTQTVDLDLRSMNIRLSGYEGLAISHRTNNSDRVWAARIAPYLSTEIDTATYSTVVERADAEPDFKPVGQKFCIQLIIEHDYEIPSVRVRPQSGSMFAEYNSVAAWEFGSNNASVVDLSSDGFDDVMFDSLFTVNQSGGVLELRTVEVLPEGSRFGADISAWTDLDRDGDLDCIIHDHVTQAIRVLRTDSLAHFTDITNATGIVASGATSVLLWFDAENDGDVDVFIGRDAQDMLWINNGNGTFRDATVESGLAAAEPLPGDICGSASLGDINVDGLTDIMVVTRGASTDRLLVNAGAGKFTSISTPGRIGSASQGSHGNGEGSEWGDFNGDGIDDILVANSVRVDAADALQDASMVWRTRSTTSMLFDTLWGDLGLPFVGATNGYTAADINLDGMPDFATVVPDTQFTMHDRAYVSILMQGRIGSRRVYSRSAFAFGLPITDVGFALRTDVDMDGDPDFIVNRTSVLRNNLSNTNNGITIRLRNEGRSTITPECFGSRVSVHAGSTFKRIYFPGTISTGRGSANSASMTVGVGTATVVDSIVVTYSDKSTRTFKNLGTNGAYSLGTSGAIVRIAGAPRQQEPYFNAIEVPANGPFTWSSMGAGITYDLQVSQDTNFFTVLRDIKAISGTSHTLALALPTSAEYLWRIRAHFTDGSVSHWSTPWPLTVGKVIPGGLLLRAPDDGSVTYVPDVDLRWTHQNDSRQVNALTQYRVQVAKDNAFTTVERENIMDETLMLTSAGLDQATKYYWRVQPIQSGVDGIWSNVWSFSTSTFPGAIELLTPPNGQENVDAITRLTWKRPVGLDPRSLGTYLLHFGLDSMCTDILDTGTSSDTMRRAQYLLLDQKYYWRVRVVTPFGNGPWSPIWWFKTGFILDVDEDVVVSEQDQQPTAFPTPFSDRVTIALPPTMYGEEQMHLKVHDIHGTELYSAPLRSTTVDLDATGWPSGPVCISIVANERVHRIMAIRRP